MRKTLLSLGVIAGLIASVGVYIALSMPKPEYAWLVFGPEAKVRVLVTLRGEAVTLDHYRGEEFTGRRESFANRSECIDAVIPGPDGATRYKITRIGPAVVQGKAATELFVSVNVEGTEHYCQYCDLVMGDNPRTTRFAHFGGPLSATVRTINWELPPDLALRRGDKPTDLQVCIGTMNPDNGCWVVVRIESEGKALLPLGVHPFVDVEFPHRQSGRPAVKRRYALDHVC